MHGEREGFNPEEQEPLTDLTQETDEPKDEDLKIGLVLEYLKFPSKAREIIDSGRDHEPSLQLHDAFKAKEGDPDEIAGIKKYGNELAVVLPVEIRLGQEMVEQLDQGLHPLQQELAERKQSGDNDDLDLLDKKIRLLRETVAEDIELRSGMAKLLTDENAWQEKWQLVDEAKIEYDQLVHDINEAPAAGRKKLDDLMHRYLDHEINEAEYARQLKEHSDSIPVDMAKKVSKLDIILDGEGSYFSDDFYKLYDYNKPKPLKKDA